MSPPHGRASFPCCALVLSLLLAACGAATPEAAQAPATAPAPAPAAEPAADAALTSRVAEAAAPPPAGERCAMLVAHRADQTWLVVVRSPAQPGNVWAVVTVSAKGEGVVHIDYKP